MQDTKNIFTSKTFYGVLISVIGKLVSTYTGYNIDEETEAQITSLVALGISFAGDAMAIYGRIKATKRIK